MKRSTTVCIAYCGEKVNAGSMNVAMLGASVIAFGELINRANKVLNNDNSKVDVQVNADFHRGSFEIVMSLIQTLPEQVMSLFSTSYDIEQIATLLDLTNNGKELAVASGAGLLWLIKKAGGKKIQKSQQVGNNISITVEGGTYTVKKEVYNLFVDTKARECVRDLLGPLQKNGIDGFETRNADGSGQKICRIDKDEYQKFEAMPDEVMDDQVARYNLWVKVESIVFDSSKKWRLNDGDVSFMATMQDKEFLKRIQEEEIRIGPNDLIEIELEKHQLVKNNRQIGRTENIVTKVQRYTRAE